MKKRYKESRKKTRKTFGRSADKTHVKNLGSKPMRGGTRL